MKIAIDAYQARCPHGGIGRYIRGLVPALARQEQGNQFVLFSNRFREGGLAWKPALPNVTPFEFQCPRRLLQGCWEFLGWPPVEQLIGALNIFHGTHFVLPAVRRAKCVLTVHDLTFLRHPEYFSDHTLNEHGYRHELPRALARADAVIAVSHHTRQDLVDLLGYPESRIWVIHEGVESHFFVGPDAADLASVKARYDLTHPYLVFLVGTPEPRKNLIRTVAATRRAAPFLPLVIIGPQEPIRILLGNDLQGVRLIGSVPDIDLPLLLRGAEVALYPSLYEGFGLPALEALATGVPLITSNRSAIPEVVKNAAVLVNPESEEELAAAIQELVNNGERRQDLSKQGQARAKELSWGHAAARVMELYGQLV